MPEFRWPTTPTTLASISFWATLRRLFAVGCVVFGQQFELAFLPSTMMPLALASSTASLAPFSLSCRGGRSGRRRADVTDLDDDFLRLLQGRSSFRFCFRLFFLAASGQTRCYWRLRSLRERIYWTVSCGGILRKTGGLCFGSGGLSTRKSRARRRFQRFRPIFACEIPMMRAFIFDMDGWLTACRSTNRRGTPADARAGWVDRDEFSAGRRTDQPRNLPAPARPGLADDELQALSERKEALYRQLYAPHCAPLRGAVEFFLRETERAGIQRAVGTAALPENVTLVLDGLICGGIFRRWWAAPISATANRTRRCSSLPRRLGVRPADCVVFEDARLGSRRRVERACNALLSPPH